MGKLKLPRRETNLDKLNTTAKQLSAVIVQCKVEPDEFVALVEYLGIEDTQMLELVLSHVRREMKQDQPENS